MKNNDLINTMIPGYAIIDMKILQDKNLIPFDVVLYSVISGLANNDKNCCFCGNRYLTKILNCSERNIQKSLVRLKKYNYIEVKIVRGNYRIIKTYLNIALELREKKLKDLQERARKLELMDYDWLNENGRL